MAGGTRAQARARGAGVREWGVDPAPSGQLIQEKCGVQYHPGHVCRILRQLGWTQKPTGRALERDEQAIGRPEREAAGWVLRKCGAPRENHSLYRREWTERAAATSTDLGAVGTDSGLAVSFHLEEALSHREIILRTFYFRRYLGPVHGQQLVDSLGCVSRHVRGKLLMVWDGLSCHRSRSVREYLEGTSCADRHRVACARLHPRTEPGRVPLGPPEEP